MTSAATAASRSALCWLLLLAPLAAPRLTAQPAACNHTVAGRVVSEHEAELLAYATVYAVELGRGVQADSAGRFALGGLCPGPLTLRFSHVGCDDEHLRLHLTADTSLTAYLHHHDNYVETVTVTSDAAAAYSRDLDRRATGQLTEALEEITGVSTLRTGTAATKPVYDGLFGNRLSIQNNGIAQSGQQWGNDHAPEIDPWTAAYVRIVEGVEALRYAGPTAGATVLVEPAPLREHGPAGGTVAYTFNTNCRGHILNARLGRGGRTAYRLSASGRLDGDHRAPDYLLRNTGRREAAAALQLARFHGARWTSRAYYSIFHANVGVLRGSHIGNLTDLRAAFGRDEPFFTTDSFTYRLEPPRQAVVHHLLKAETEFRPNADNRLTLRYGGQLDNRREFDVRRGGRSDRPALSLRQWSHQLEAAWHRELGPERHLDASLQYVRTDNNNRPGTGVLPLIPDYNAHRWAGHLAYHREAARWQYHAGLRFDYAAYEAITITATLPRRIERIRHHYPALSGSAEARRDFGEHFSLRGGLTLRQRAPEINELYSQGLHQGVSGIEEGDPTLRPEHSVKASAGLRLRHERLQFNANLYLQPIADYIYLQPQQEPRLTIRGAFPVFIYRAGDVLLRGGNFHLRYLPAAGLALDGRLALVRGRNRTEGNELVYLPADNLRLGATYTLGREGRLWSLGWENFLSARQSRIGPEQDFLAPPDGYWLTDLSVEYQHELPHHRTLLLRAAAHNLLDVAYRDYLDRQRYYADAPGRNLSLRVVLEW